MDIVAPANPKLRYMASEFDTHFKVFHELMSNKVMDILLVASAYDAYMLEEDGSLASRIINEYHGLNLSRPPRITRVHGVQEALDAIASHSFDMVITMPYLGGVDSFDFGLTIKRLKPDLPVILLAHSIHGFFPLPAQKNSSGIDQIFIWSGDSDLLLAIVKSVEDQRNVDNDTQKAQVRVIILVEDSPLYRSYFLPLMYKEVVQQTQEVLEESLNEEHRLLKMRARPKILVAETYEAALALYQRYQPYLFAVVSDTRFPRNRQLCPDAGIQFLSQIKSDIPDLPMLLISDEPNNRSKARDIPAHFLDKNSPNLFDELHTFFLDYLGFGDFVFRNADGTEVARAASLRHLEEILPSIPEEPLRYHATRNRFSNWIMARSEIVLASQLRRVKVSDFPDIEALRQYLVTCIHGLRKWRQKGVVAQFDAKAYDAQISDIVKIGKGSLGGKGRGMAFVNNLLRHSPHFLEKFDSIDIRIPSTLVITTDGFDAFVAQNNLQISQFIGCSDAEIAEAFAGAEPPAEIEADLAAYLHNVHYPLSVRSSSLLEDAQHLPLTGLYKTLMVPNDHPDMAVRLAQLIAAIKQVYASTWFEQPRRFTLSTAYRHRKERMAVIIQQIAGRAYGHYFYPMVSGIARSQDYYAISHIQPDDGMAKIALGLGRIIASGKAGLRFCPKFPSILPDFTKIEDILTNAQSVFFALPVGNTSATSSERILETNLTLRNVADALDEPPVQALISTYLPQEERIRDAPMFEGPKLVTFASLLKYKIFPLADLLNDFLILARDAMGCHVELEFALDLPQNARESAVFYVLQIRPMPIGSDPYDIDLVPGDQEKSLCFSSKALGHGKYNQIADIVYVDPQRFNAARTRSVAAQIKQINAMLKAEGRSYLLIGPGRWGSFDPWLGIPVKWDDISGVGAMIELRNTALKAEPSQGSHFFQHITAEGIPYLTIDEDGIDHVRWDEMAQYEIVQQTELLCHVRSPGPLLIKCNGRTAQCVVFPAAIP